ncbi:MAG: bifunctional homocysteine S-methyltransferase/methylenetetrahydrofolate reductase [Acidobacteriota bacterium]|nr:bifunctional homocysteine S-methyltransferase/methylenetetrahydrofolate reductase [Acidobacteriota bacterium]
MRAPFLERIQKQVLVADGAMGTMLYSMGFPFSRCFDELNLSSPQSVKEVHLAYIKSGADVLETNTFGANRARLERHDLAGKVREINLAGARLAREVAGEDRYVAGAVGPLGLRLEPLGPTSLADGRAMFREQVEALAEGGADLIVLETMTGVQEARQALLAVREACGLPVAAQMTIQEDGNSPGGISPEDFARLLDDWGADLIGINCSVGPAGVLDALERMAKVTTRKLSAQPNAGLPRTVEGRSLYLCSPDYMAEYAARFIEAGARMVGGCCGTTPDHIRAIKRAVRSLNPRVARPDVEVREWPQPPEPLPTEQRSPLALKLARREFPLLVEVIPPKGPDAAREVEGVEFLRTQGIDAVTITDNPGGAARMSAQSLALLIQQRTGFETVLQYSCRGRNVVAIQSDLLGASALGLANVLATTGAASLAQADPNVTPVFDVDSIGLVNIIRNLNRGLDAGGNPIGAQTSFLTGVRVNPNALHMDEEIRRFEYKVEAGASFAIAQPVFEVDQLIRFLKRLDAAGGSPIPILAGIFTLASYRNAEFLNNEVPGVTVPQRVLERMRKADAGDRARAEGLKIAQEVLLEMRGLVAGVQISAPFGRYATAAEVAGVLGRTADREA